MPATRALPPEAQKSETLFSDCPGREILNHLTGRWSPLVMLALIDGEARFHVLRNRIEGISEKMLSQTLQMLIRDGFIDRTVKPSVPPQVSYCLTPLGTRAAEALNNLVIFLQEHTDEVVAARRVFDLRH